ncbi:methyltransferase-like protein [Gracilaria domingensis]|nr:methyltransferase-like protein [Gracilaria domingensis]
MLGTHELKSLQHSAREQSFPPNESKPQSNNSFHYGEARGARKRARALQTKARHKAIADRAAELAKPPNSAAEAAERWDAFYETKPTLFKDRHVLRAAFPDLVAPHAAANPTAHVPPLSPVSKGSLVDRGPSSQCDQVLVEVGCGAGNAVYPLLRANPRLFAFAFDFSTLAVELTKSSPEYREDRIRAFQADVARLESYVDFIRNNCADGVRFVTVLWTLSALDPSQHSIAANGLVALLAHGGQLFVRDYATGDMREKRFAEREQRVGHGSDKLYLRGDGTYAYFFSREELKELFEGAGLTCVSCEYEDREVNNRKTQSIMRRRWVQAKFRKG